MIDKLKKIKKLTELMQVPVNRRLDANCIVFINKWILEERQESQKEILLEIVNNTEWSNGEILEYINERLK